jgi:DnaK suppressor protein
MPVAKRKPTRKFAQFEELIKEQRRRLRQRLAADDGDDLQEQVPEDEAGTATKSLIDDLELDTRQRRFKLLSDIEFALQRLREGTYGICDRCGREISERRLQALPWTQLCLDCAEKRQNHSSN